MTYPDAFSKCHPAVCFLFFLGAIGFGVVILHPAYLLAGLLGAAIYYLLLKGRKGLKTVALLLPVAAIVAFINPLFNTQGSRILFRLFGRPYTLEALLYGAAIAVMFLVMMLWFGCYNDVMTSDKFTSLFGNLIPALSLLLVMVLRMIPALIRKTRQITGARMSIGKGSAGTNRQKAESGMVVLSALASWALEGSVVTADSMRSRGYGTARRTSFQIYTMKSDDWTLLGLQLILAAAVLVSALTGGSTASFTPELQIAPMKGFNIAGLAAYCAYLLIPSALHLREALLWHISRSRI